MVVGKKEINCLMFFLKTHRDLEPGKYFNTVWVKLPDDVLEYLQRVLDPIKSNLKWSVLDDGQGAHSVPHITLRYLGYDSADLRQKMKSDEVKFRKIIRIYSPMEIQLGEVFIWEGVDSNGNKTYRLNWKIVDRKKLTELHQELLKILGYDLFKSLEQENYTPHISLGEINLKAAGNVDQVKEYLNNLSENVQTVVLKDFGLNFSSPNPEENYRVSLN